VSSALSGMLTATAPSFCIAHTRQQPSANRVTFGAAQVNMPGRAAAPEQLYEHLPQAQLIAAWSTLGLHFRRPPPSVPIATLVHQSNLSVGLRTCMARLCWCSSASDFLDPRGACARARSSLTSMPDTRDRLQHGCP
jgi:hypothetical protein